MGAADRSDVERPIAGPPIDLGCGSRIEAAAQAWALDRSTEILPRSWKAACTAMGALAGSCDLVKCSDRFGDFLLRLASGAGMEGLASAFGYGTSCKHDRNVLELIIKSKEKFKTPPMLDIAPYKHNLKKLTNKRKRAVSAAERKINQLVREGKLIPRGKGFIRTDRPSMDSYALGKAYPSIISPYSNDIKDVRVMLGHIIMSREKSKAPLMLDLACHGVFGIVDGFPLLSFKEGITVASPLKDQFPTVSIPDIYQLAGVIMVEATGGPSVGFHPGRS